MLPQNRIFINGKVCRAVSSITGLVTEYHGLSTVRAVNHVENPPTSEAIKQRLNETLTQNAIDGWCESVTVVSRLLGDSVRFDSFIAATEVQEGTLIIVQVPTAVAIAFLALCTVALAIGAWFMWTSIQVAKETLIDRYIADDGQVFKSERELYFYYKTKYWLVCPKCLTCAAPKTEYPAYENIPQETIDKFNEHVDSCPGLPAKEIQAGQLLLWGLIAVVAVGGIWLIGKFFGIFTPKKEGVYVVK